MYGLVIAFEAFIYFVLAFISALVAQLTKGGWQLLALVVAVFFSALGFRLVSIIKRKNKQYYAERAAQQEQDRMRNPALYAALDELLAWRVKCGLPGTITVGFGQKLGGGHSSGAVQYDLHVDVYVDIWSGETPVSVGGMPFEALKAQVPSSFGGFDVVVLAARPRATK